MYLINLTNMQIFRAKHRGAMNIDWLQARYYFSFAYWMDPSRLGVGPIRVVNNDIIAPAGGFPSHSHREMEIITIPLRGAVKHEDSGDGRGIVGAGEVQIMSAGAGVTHSEYNASDTEELELFQIWIETAVVGGPPRYEQASYEVTEGGWTTLTGPVDSSAPTTIQQQAFIKRGKFSEPFTPKSEASSANMLIIVSGKVEVNDQEASDRDSIEWYGSEIIEIEPQGEVDVLWINTVS